MLEVELDTVPDRQGLAAADLTAIENLLLVTIYDHEPENGCTIAHYYGTELVLPSQLSLPKGASTRVAVRSNDIALSKRYISGTSIQNQIKGRICTVIRGAGHAVVQVDCGSTMLAGISLRALKQMDLREGDTVYCLIKAHAFTYSAPAADASPAKTSH